MMVSSVHRCEETTNPDFFTSPERKHGERWRCPLCYVEWIFTVDGATGSQWWPSTEPAGGKRPIKGVR